MRKVKIQLGSIVLASSLVLGSCGSMNNTEKGAGIGAAGGAILGGIIGNQIGSGHSGAGAVIGGLIGGATGGMVGNRMDRQAEEIENEVPGAKVEKINDGEGISVTFDENGGGVVFPTGKYALSSESKGTLDKLVTVFQEYPDTDLQVQGHTDDVGQDASNLTLSKNRAMEVQKYLVSKGVSESRITTKWFGETKPKVTNDSDANRAMNRRVEVYITANEKMIEDAEKEAEQQAK